MIIIMLLPILCFCINAQQAPTWLASPYFVAGQVKLVFANTVGVYSRATAGNYNYTQYYYTPNSLVNIPLVIQGLTSFDFTSSTSPLGFTNSINSINKIGYTIYLTVYNNTYITQLTFQYFAVDSSFNNVSLYAVNLTMNSVNSGTGNRSEVQLINLSSGFSSTITVLRFINGFHINPNNSMYSIIVDASYYNSSTINITVSTTNNSCITNVTLHLLVYDLQYIQSSYLNFIDSFVIEGFNSQRTTPVPSSLVGFNYRNFIFGMNSFIIQPSQDLVIDFRSLNYIYTNQSYLYTRFDSFNFRVRSCSTSYPDFLPNTTSCYSSCPSFYYLISTTNYCLPCKYSCLSSACSTSSFCSNCSDVNNTRYVDSNTNQCLCISGYYINFTLNQCSACNYSCQTCTGLYVCTACYSNRLLLSNGSCTCVNNSYFDDGNSQNCLLCDYSCSSCSKISNNCSNCSSSAFRVISTNSSTNLTSCLCSSGYFDNGSSICQSCISSCLTCSNNTSNCTSCDSSLNRNLINNSCPCLSNYYLNNQTCSSCNSTCLTCNSSTVCLSCDNTTFRVLSNNQCICQSGYYSNTSTVCKSCDSTCLTCDSNGCLSCQANRSLSSVTCPCSIGYYQSNSACSICNYTCLTCSLVSTNCTSCDNSALRVLSNSTCQCMSNYIDKGFTQCSALVCDYTCDTCTNQTTCTHCLSSAYRFLNNSQCSCNSGFYDNKSETCVEICGDNVLYILECDDGNLINGDGCSSTCKIESGWQCEGNGSICSYTSPLTLTLQSCEKSAYSNVFVLGISIIPVLAAVSNINFSQSITLSNVNITNTSYTYSNGILSMSVGYSSTVEGSNVTLQFIPSVSSNKFTSTTSQSYKFGISSTNNQALVYYSDSVYSGAKLNQNLCLAIECIGLIGFAIFMFVSPLIAIQMIMLVQIIFLSMSYAENLSPLIVPLSSVKYVNGYNLQVSNNPSNFINSRIQTIGYFKMFVDNFNLMQLTIVLPLLTGFVLFIIAAKFQNKSQTLRRIGKKLWFQYFAIFILFNLANVTFSFGLHILYNTSHSTFNTISIIEIVSLFILILFCFISFYMKPHSFGILSSSFKEDKLSQCQLLVLALFRIIFVLILVLANQSLSVCYLLPILCATFIVYLIIKKPYLAISNNIRAISNEITLFVFLCYFSYLRVNSTKITYSSFQLQIPTIILSLLLVIVIGNIIYLCFISFGASRMIQDDMQQMQEMKYQTVAKNILEKQRNYQSLMARGASFVEVLGQKRNFYGHIQRLESPKKNPEENAEKLDKIHVNYESL